MTTTSSLLYVPASKLSIAPANVRKRTDAVADAELKASIQAHGVLQNLIGLPVPRKKGQYQITAGGRRLTQVQALIAEGVLPADQELPIMLLSNRNDAAEISLVENFERLDMTPAEECLGFQAIMAAEKNTPADIARRFGLTERFVLGRLRLAGLADSIFEALADGAISLDVAKAYGSISDTDRQAAVFAELCGSYYATNCSEIRRRLISGFYRGSDPKALLIGRETYLAAGGRIEGDLFSDSETENWIDSEIVDRLAEAQMEAAAQAMRSTEGFGELRVVCESRVPYMATVDLQTIEAEPEPLTDAEEERQRAIEVELEAIAEQADEDGYSEEEIGQIERLEAEYEALTERPPAVTAEQKAGALAYLVIGQDGMPRLHEQYYALPADAPEAESDEAGDFEGGDVSDETIDGTEQEADNVGRPAISQRLGDELAMMKAEILRVHVATDPHFALDLGTFIMVDMAITYRYDMPSELRALAPGSRVSGFESDTAAAQSWHELEAGLDRSWCAGGDIVERYDGFCALDDAARAAWLAWAIARTLQAVPAGAAGSGLIDHLGTKLDIDVAAWWRPTARRYFDRVSKPVILGHFETVGGLELRNRYSGSKKHDLALSAEKLFAGQIITDADTKERAMAWLPDVMRFSAGDAPMPDAAVKLDEDDAMPLADDEAEGEDGQLSKAA